MSSLGESTSCFSAALRANDIIKRGAVFVQEAIPLRARNDVFDAVVGRLMDRTKPVRKQALATAATFLRTNPYGDTLKACGPHLDHTAVWVEVDVHALQLSVYDTYTENRVSTFARNERRAFLSAIRLGGGAGAGNAGL
jgi:hypothetical protein